VKRVLVVLMLAAFADSVAAEQYVRPLVRSDSPYEGYWRNESDKFRFDNYSSQVNINPYTSERGYERHEFSNPPVYPNLYRKQW